MAKNTTGSNGANLGFEEKLWQTADKLRNNMDAAEKSSLLTPGTWELCGTAPPANLQMKKSGKFPTLIIPGVGKK
ncbi:MAG: hypothetical protein PHT13_12090 [Methanosarcina sp.]|nr:hypothetical protein [Methanosarcina sp.]